MASAGDAAVKGTARRVRERKQRAMARHVSWLTSMLQSVAAHHTAGIASSGRRAEGAAADEVDDSSAWHSIPRVPSEVRLAGEDLRNELDDPNPAEEAEGANATMRAVLDGPEPEAAKAEADTPFFAQTSLPTLEAAVLAEAVGLAPAAVTEGTRSDVDDHDPDPGADPPIGMMECLSAGRKGGGMHSCGGGGMSGPFHVHEEGEPWISYMRTCFGKGRGGFSGYSHAGGHALARDLLRGQHDKAGTCFGKRGGDYSGGGS